ncbi:type II secretion system F family protein [Oceanobacillus halophilus]|uniref:Type II secretion system protein n=1 Tax=Oceanobacillus halophilus TaxID=930130 RepID=A0A495A1L9_9BACI|nr:type II secretion system F family protein [Oceanobacillus halophilus]RKQ33254.1 type II secretion system protein [Oceanobacillus halophilus]
MMLFLLLSFFLTSLFLFYIILQRLFPPKKELVKDRINRYLYNEKKEKVESKSNQEAKKVRFQINLDKTKKNVRERFLSKDKNRKLEIALYRAGVPLKPEEFIMFQWIAIALGAGILYLIIDSIIMLPIGALIGFYIPKFIIKKKQQDRLKAFNNDLPEMISAVIGGLKAGFSFPQALKSFMEEARSPMKEELATALREMQYGSTTEEALHHLHERMPSEDLDIMIQAIIIQRQVGGNLATVLEKIVQTIRERIKIQGQIKTLTAQGRMSGIVIGLLPVILGMVLYLIQPEYIGALFSHPVGIILVVVAVISCSIGFFLIQKITTIEV